MNQSNIADPDEMRPEYDFSGAVQGKHQVKYRAGVNSDVAEVFKDSESANRALRLLLDLAKSSCRRIERHKTGLTRSVPRETLKTHSRKLIRRIAKDSARPNDVRDAAFRQRILSIPKGKVATYGQVASAAGYPLYHRAVARLLRNTSSDVLPWQRVIGAGGVIKLRYEARAEQRLRLEMEGVGFRGRKVDLVAHQHVFGPWHAT